MEKYTRLNLLTFGFSLDQDSNQYRYNGEQFKMVLDEFQMYVNYIEDMICFSVPYNLENHPTIMMTICAYKKHVFAALYYSSQKELLFHDNSDYMANIDSKFFLNLLEKGARVIKNYNRDNPSRFLLAHNAIWMPYANMLDEIIKIMDNGKNETLDFQVGRIIDNYTNQRKNLPKPCLQSPEESGPKLM